MRVGLLRQQDRPVRKPDRVITIVAERFTFNPSRIKVKQGELIEFVLTSDDTDHGFRIPGAGIDVAIPPSGKGEARVRFIAKEKGQFTFRMLAPVRRRAQPDARNDRGEVMSDSEPIESRAAVAVAVSRRLAMPDRVSRQIAQSGSVLPGSPLPGHHGGGAGAVPAGPGGLHRGGDRGGRPGAGVQREQLRGMPQRAGDRRHQHDDGGSRRIPGRGR